MDRIDRLRRIARMIRDANLPANLKSVAEEFEHKADRLAHPRGPEAFAAAE